MSASHHSAFSDLTYRCPSQGPGQQAPWPLALVWIFGASYQLAVELVIEVKLSSAVAMLSTAAINEVCTSTLSETTRAWSRSNLSCRPSSPSGCQARLQGEGAIIIGLTDQHLLTLEHFFGWAAQLSIVFRLSLDFFMLARGLASRGRGAAVVKFRGFRGFRFLMEPAIRRIRSGFFSDDHLRRQPLVSGRTGRPA